jgi:hypothetical protein
VAEIDAFSSVFCSDDRALLMHWSVCSKFNFVYGNLSKLVSAQFYRSALLDLPPCSEYAIFEIGFKRFFGSLRDSSETIGTMPPPKHELQTSALTLSFRKIKFVTDNKLQLLH